jgi:hypothetical protein
MFYLALLLRILRGGDGVSIQPTDIPPPPVELPLAVTVQLPFLCDRCHVRAWSEWWRSEGQCVLDLCRHHSNKHRVALQAAGWVEFTEVDDTPPPAVLEPA